MHCPVDVIIIAKYQITDFNLCPLLVFRTCVCFVSVMNKLYKMCIDLL